MSRLEEIKNKISREGGYYSFIESLKDNSLNRSSVIAGALDKIIDKVCKEYAKEVAQASLEKASESGCDSLELYNSEYETLKKSITNESNIVLL